MALCSYPCRTIEEARIKAAYLQSAPSWRDKIGEENFVRALLRSFSKVQA
jgi:hypothetical protein